jgi:hypothetical protein
MSGCSPGLSAASVLDDRIHIAEACVVDAGHDARDGRRRAFALVYGNVETFGFKIALVLRPEIPSVNALDFPIEREANLCVLRRGA